MIAHMETTPPPMEPIAVNPAPTTSLAARMFNVLAAPGDVFDEVKNSRPSTANWLAPVLLALVVGIISVLIVNTQPAVLQKIHEQQTKAFEKQVQSGKMTQAQADQAEAMAGKFTGPAFLDFVGSIAVVVITFVRLFWWALVLWLLGKWFLHAGFSYQQGLEVAGLISMIMILSSIVTMLLTIWMGEWTPLNLALLSRNADPQSLQHMVLAAGDFFDFWAAGVLAIGLARLAAVPVTKALSLIVAYWLVMDTLLVSAGWFLAHLGSGFK
jgi:hypothetical protein